MKPEPKLIQSVCSVLFRTKPTSQVSVITSTTCAFHEQKWRLIRSSLSSYLLTFPFYKVISRRGSDMYVSGRIEEEIRKRSKPVRIVSFFVFLHFEKYSWTIWISWRTLHLHSDFTQMKRIKLRFNALKYKHVRKEPFHKKCVEPRVICAKKDWTSEFLVSFNFNQSDHPIQELFLFRVPKKIPFLPF